MHCKNLHPLMRLGVLLIAGVTAAHLLFWSIAPFRSAHPEGPVWLAILLFEGVLAATIVLAARPTARIAGDRHGDWQSDLAALPIHRLFWIALGGLVFHLLAKSELINSVTFECPTLLREAWIRHDRSQDPLWLRASSMLGHVGSQFAMPGLLFSAFQITYGRRGWAQWSIFSGCAGVIIFYSAAIMSRSTMLTALLITGLGVALGLCMAGSSLWSRLRNGGLALALFLGAAMLFNLAIFNSKVECGERTDIRYVQANLVGTDVGLTSNRFSGKLWDSLRVLPSVQYLNHALWNFAIIHDTEARGSPLLLSFVNEYLARIGIGRPGEVKTRVHSLGGSTLPGAAYHDHGYPGLLAAALGVGACWALGAAMLMRGRSWRLLGIACLVAAGLTIALSLLFVGPATMSFPFVIFAFLVCALGVLPAPDNNRPVIVRGARNL
jgi:hypothetical protein